jgi:hypothetical protein
MFRNRPIFSCKNEKKTGLDKAKYGSSNEYALSDRYKARRQKIGPIVHR